MSRERCRLPTCDREPDSGRFCSEQHEVKYDHLKDAAVDARGSVERHHDDVPRHDSGGGRL